MQLSASLVSLVGMGSTVRASVGILLHIPDKMEVNRQWIPNTCPFCQGCGFNPEAIFIPSYIMEVSRCDRDALFSSS